MKKRTTFITGVGALIVGVTGCVVNASANASTKVQPTAKVHAASRTSEQVKPALNSWTGKGDVALISNDKASQGLNGGKLYTVLSDNSTTAPKPQFIADHVISAEFSPDGKWLAVVTLGSSSSQNTANGQTLWLMSADGTRKQKLSEGNVISGAWVQGSDTYVYGSNPVYSVKPGKTPVRLAAQLPKNATVSQYESSENSKSIAIVTTQPTPGQDITGRFDSIDVLNPATGALRVLKKGQPSDGFILGPWMNSTTLFYYADPMHSASLIADGAQLSTISTSGKTQKLTTTLTGIGTISVSSTGKSAIQVGSGRTLFASKSIGVWDGHTMLKVPASTHTVAVWPVIDSKASHVAYVQGPALTPNAAEAQTQAWWNKLQLATYSVQTHKTTVLQGAGDGVMFPYYDKARDAIVYVKDNALYWISSDGKGSANKVATFSGPVWESYPQQGSPTSLEIADYQP